MRELAFLSAVELGRMLEAREVSSRELLDHYLDRIERLNPRINAIVTLDAERARKAAEQADRAIARGSPHSSLYGLPITVKDLIDTAGLRTTLGAPEFGDHVPSDDAPTVRSLKQAGAIVIGKTNTPAYGGDHQTYNSIFGTTNNPWDLNRSPGGSSGGSAAAVAAGLAALDLGTDGAGSLRSPAHYCGVYAHKPSFRVVSSFDNPPDMVGFGPIARSADDLGVVVDVLAGPSDADARAWAVKLPAPRHEVLKDYRLAAWIDDPACPPDAAVSERLAAAVDALRKKGLRIDDRARPRISLADAARTFFKLFFSVSSPGIPAQEFAAMVKMAEQFRDDDDSPPARFFRATTLSHREWLIADSERARMRAAWAEFFAQFDVMLCPVTPVVAIPHDHSEPIGARTIQVNGSPRPYSDAVVWNGAIASLAYLPATVAPAGRTREGLPVGIQLVGPYLEDLTTIDFARRIADVLGGFEPPPGF